MNKELLIKIIIGSILFGLLYAGIEFVVTRQVNDPKLIIIASVLWGVMMALIEEFFFVKKLPD